MSAEYVFTLVHGTWARNAPWADESSSLCRGLKDKFPSSPLIFERFQWSGRNSFSARRKATSKLIAHMKQMDRKWPNAHHYIIAHSHGGNIALYALRNNEVNRKVTGIVSLATPFLHARPRDLGPYGSQLLSGASLLVILAVVMVMPHIIFPLIPLLIPLQMLSEWIVWVFLLFSAIMFLALVWGSFMWKRWGEGLLHELSFPIIEPHRLLIVRSIGDEAQAALAGVQVLGWMSMRIWRRVSSVMKFVNAPPVGTWIVWRVLWGLFWYPLGVLATIVGLLLIPFVVLVSILLLAFGPDLALAGPFVDIAIEATPEGSWLVHQLPSLGGQQLSHSQSYEHPHTVELIAPWIKAGGMPVPVKWTYLRPDM